MSKRILAPVNPQMLKWARENIGYDIKAAAKKIGVSERRLADFETGKAKPNTNQLFKISKQYDCPYSAFFFSAPPNQLKQDLGRLGDWRRIHGTGFQVFSPALVLELREIERRREILLDLAEETGDEIPEFVIPKPPAIDPESATLLASSVRELLGVTIEQQKKWRDQYVALKVWRKSIEHLGVMVCQTGIRPHLPVETEEMRGIAIWKEKLPTILVNGRDSPTGRIFTLIHELGHIILRLSGVSDNSDTFDDISFDWEEEIFCNEFAGELLVPSSELKREAIVIKNRNLLWDDQDLNYLSNRYKVSKVVILRRLLKLRKTSNAHYNEKCKQWKKEWIEQQELQEKTKKTGWVPPHRKFLRCHGFRFVSSIFGAYDKEFIHASQLSDYLGAKMNHVPKIVNELVSAT